MTATEELPGGEREARVALVAGEPLLDAERCAGEGEDPDPDLGDSVSEPGLVSLVAGQILRAGGAARAHAGAEHCAENGRAPSRHDPNPPRVPRFRRVLRSVRATCTSPFGGRPSTPSSVDPARKRPSTVRLPTLASTTRRPRARASGARSAGFFPRFCSMTR